MIVGSVESSLESSLLHVEPMLMLVVVLVEGFWGLCVAVVLVVLVSVSEKIKRWRRYPPRPAATSAFTVVQAASCLNHSAILPTVAVAYFNLS